MKKRTKRPRRNALDRLVASRVMGRTRLPRGWSPSTNYRDAMDVVVRMGKQPRNISIAHSPVTDRWIVMFLSYRKTDGSFVVAEDGTHEDRSLPVAVCTAALRSVGVAGGAVVRAVNEAGL